MTREIGPKGTPDTGYNISYDTGYDIVADIQNSKKIKMQSS